MVCVSCGKNAGVDTAFVEYSPGNIKLRRCPDKACGLVLDKYVEYERFLIALDIIMLYPGAYRHVLFNTKQSWSGTVSSFVFVTLLEFYVRMYYLDDVMDWEVLVSAAAWSSASSLAGLAISWTGKSDLKCFLVGDELDFV